MFQDGQLFNHLTRRPQRRLRAAAAPYARAPPRGCASCSRWSGSRGTTTGCPRPCPAASGSGSRWPARSPSQPRLLLLDEPLSALDAGLRERLAADLRDILRAAGTTALMVTHDHEEAFTVADRLAVMRAGRVVQQGDIAEVWRAPADPETALFLGYARVLDGARGRRAAAAAGLPGRRAAVAVRRSALVVADDGPLPGVVVSARATPEQIRLVVDVDGVGEIDAVARSDTPPGAGRPGVAGGRRHPARADHP